MAVRSGRVLPGGALGPGGGDAAAPPRPARLGLVTRPHRMALDVGILRRPAGPHGLVGLFGSGLVRMPLDLGLGLRLFGLGPNPVALLHRTSFGWDPLRDTSTGRG